MSYIMVLIAAGLSALSCAAIAHADPPPVETVRLWEGDAPGALGQAETDIPTLTLYRPAPEKRTGAAVVICPGGGYGFLADYEGRPIAEWLAGIGITGIVLKYRLAPHYHHPVMLHDVQRALRMTRFHAQDWNLDTKRIGVLGFSAGGHLASTAATHFDAGDASAQDPIDRVGSRPDAAILIYPVITMTHPYTHDGSRQNLLGPNPSNELVDLMSSEKQVTAQTPPSFLIASDEDAAVPCENSLLYVMACRNAKVPVELHIYRHGPHGFGMGGNDPVLSGWPTSCALWLKSLGFLSK